MIPPTPNMSQTTRSRPVITIMLADAEHMVRKGFRCLLDRQKDFKVVGEVADGLAAVRRVGRLRPRVAMLAVALPGLDTLEVTRRIRESQPGTAVVVVSRYTSAALVATALRHGAASFVAKQARPADLCNAIRRAVADKRSLRPPIAGLAAKTRGAAAHDAYETLTTRQREVFQLTAEGHSRVDTARRLRISARTSEAHRADALAKLGLRTRVDVIRYALARRILAPPGGPETSGPKSPIAGRPLGGRRRGSRYE